jgi:AraC-like DNA-binding protein
LLLAGNDGKGGFVAHCVFSSDQFPKELSERERLRRWQEYVEEHYGGRSMSFAPERRFFAHAELVRAGTLRVDYCRSTLIRGVHTARQVAADGNDDLFVSINIGRSSMVQRQLGRQVEHAPGSLLLLSNGEPREVTSKAGVHWLTVYIPRRMLLERVRRAEDLIARRLEADPPIVRYLGRYLRHLVEAGDTIGHPAIAEHVSTTLLDLIVTALESGRDGAMLHRPGMRGAHLQEALSLIESSYDNPAFSAPQLAAKLGLTQRYVQDLLHETGRTFSERVMELRLQKARGMLSNPHHDRLKISDIAYACGFNEVSYFNRCFRRRFGSTPGEFRGGGVG